MNPKKTDGGILVSTYACSPETAADEFMLFRQEYQQNTGRTRENEVIAYHVRQAFKPEEITPEEANRLGYELAKRFTKGNHSFVVSTHTDMHHIHSHIIFNAVNLSCDRKFKNFWGSSKAIQRLSDLICLENG